MTVDTAALRTIAGWIAQRTTGSSATTVLSAADELEELRSLVQKDTTLLDAANRACERAASLLTAECAAHSLTKEQLADLERQLRLAEVARDASREAYDAEHAALAETKRKLVEYGSAPIEQLPSGTAARAIAVARDFYRDIAESSDAGALTIGLARQLSASQTMLAETKRELEEMRKRHDESAHVSLATLARLESAEAALKLWKCDRCGGRTTEGYYPGSPTQLACPKCEGSGLFPIPADHFSRFGGGNG